MTKEQYKKDKAIIKELSSKTSKFGRIYYIFITALFAAMGIIKFFDGKPLSYSAGICYTCLPYFSIIISVGGLVPLGKEKNMAAARAQYKGSVTYLDTLCCMPVRQESVLRTVMREWRKIEILIGLLVIPDFVSSLLLFPQTLLYSVLCSAVCVVTLMCCFLICFNKYILPPKYRSVPLIIQNIIVIVMSFTYVIFIFIGMTLGEDSVPPAAPAQGVPNIGAAAAVLLALAAVCIGAETLFRRKILTKKGVGWCE